MAPQTDAWMRLYLRRLPPGLLLVQHSFLRRLD
jgi:hypothetical protein